MTVITFFNTDANVGGAGRAAYTLLKNIQDEDIRARLYVKHSGVADEDVCIIKTGFFRKGIEDYINRQCTRFGYPDRIRLTTLELARDPWIKRTDIFQLYNLHGGYFALPALPFIAGKKPIVWRMPDAWAITGKCAYPYDCMKWLSGCGGCPILDEYPSLKKDTTKWWFDRKKHIYRQCQITVVTPSHWLRSMVKRSLLLGECDVLTIPAGINMRVFQKMDKETARAKLGIHSKSPVVLFSAINFKSSRKGGRMLSEIIERICAGGPDNLIILLVGSGMPELKRDVIEKVRFLGRISSDKEMAVVYSAADIFAFPTKSDNLPKGPIESIACGTPCVASNVGGLPEIIQDSVNGLLVNDSACEAFSHAVLKLIYDEELLANLKAHCRSTVLGKFDIEDEVASYKRLYESLLGRLAPSQPVREMTRFNIITGSRNVAHSLV